MFNYNPPINVVAVRVFAPHYNDVFFAPLSNWEPITQSLTDYVNDWVDGLHPEANSWEFAMEYGME